MSLAQVHDRGPSTALSLQGAGLLIERPWLIEGFDLAALGRRARGAGADWIAVKLGHAERAWPIGTKGSWVSDAVDACRLQGLQVWGWSAIAGQAPGDEARLVAESLARYELEGWLFEPLPGYPKDLGPAFLSGLCETDVICRIGLIDHDARAATWQASDPDMELAAWLPVLDGPGAMGLLQRGQLRFDCAIPLLRGARFTDGSQRDPRRQLRDFAAAARALEHPGFGLYRWDDLAGLAGTLSSAAGWLSSLPQGAGH